MNNVDKFEMNNVNTVLIKRSLVSAVLQMIYDMSRRVVQMIYDIVSRLTHHIFGCLKMIHYTSGRIVLSGAIYYTFDS